MQPRTFACIFFPIRSGRKYILTPSRTVPSLSTAQCEGEGRLIPIEYERAIRAQYEDYVYDSRTDDYYQDGPPYV